MAKNISARDIMEAGPSHGNRPKVVKINNLTNTDYYKPIWTCKLCYTCILSINHIQKHVKACEEKHNRKHPFIDDFSFICNLCYNIVSNFELMKKHQATNHGQILIDEDIPINSILDDKLDNNSNSK